MGKILLKRLTVKNFRSFEGKHEIEFDSTGLYLVRGFNHDSRGESGSGKSTILLAIAYALDYAPYSATELRSWLNTEPFFVELELSTDQGSVVVHRGDKLWLSVNGKKITSAKAVTEKLDELTGMNKKLREAITYRKQRTFGLFLSKTDSQKKEFLVELLGLHWLEEAIEDAVKRVSAAEEEVKLAKPFVEIYEKALSEINVPEEKRLDTKSQSLRVSELRLRVMELGTKRDALAEEIGRLHATENAQIKPFEYDSSVIYNLQIGLQRCRERLKKIGSPEADRRKAENQIFRLQAEITKLFDAKCPRCDRQWDKAQQEMENNNREIALYEQAMKQAELQIEKQNSFLDIEERLMAEIEAERKKMQEAHEAHAVEMKRLMISLDRPSVKKEEELRKHDALISYAEHAFNEACFELHQMEQANVMNASMRKQQLDAFMKANAQLDHHKARVEQLTKEWAGERDYRDMLRGFLGQIFGEVLQEISAETNRILANLPNASKMTMVFETSRETADGKIKNEITPVAYFGGRQWPLESGASGGMFTSVELAVDLAVRAVVSRRTGINLGWLILDESFANGSDKITKEGCLEILKQYSTDNLIIVVEHASEFKEMFSRVIEIDYKNERSSIR